MKMKMKLLVELFGEDKANETFNALVVEVPGMHEDYYIRNSIRILA